MPFRDILVYLDPRASLEARVAVAAKLALQHGARLVGLDVTSDRAFGGDQAERAEKLEELFLEIAGSHGIEALYSVAGTAETSGAVLHAVDLFVATQAAGNDDLVLRGIPEDPLINGGVPGLILPELWLETELGVNVMIAWNGSREANRALRDSLPILKRAKKVVLFSFDRHRELKRPDLDAVVEHLKRHGVPARTDWWPDTGEMDPVNAMFASLDREGVDMIVAGAYGHSRWFEGLFGGVSRELMAQESMAVLMSH